MIDEGNKLGKEEMKIGKESQKRKKEGRKDRNRKILEKDKWEEKGEKK